MMLTILLSLLFKSCLCNPYILDHYLDIGDNDNNDPVIEMIEQELVPDSSYKALNAPTLPSAKVSAVPKCKVYEEIIKQVYELAIARNSTSSEQYKELRATIDDLFLFDICYEKACKITQNHPISDREGRLLKHIFGGLDLTIEKQVDDYDYFDDNFCDRTNFCRSCPTNSRCCSNWCWRTCEDEDIRDANSYCKTYRRSNLCMKINHCRCDDYDGDCYGRWKYNKGKWSSHGQGDSHGHGDKNWQGNGDNNWLGNNWGFDENEYFG